MQLVDACVNDCYFAQIRHDHARENVRDDYDHYDRDLARLLNGSVRHQCVKFLFESS